ncbi:hypothetical protein [Psychroflexus tropicus]|uniref:hypothetical protein n=1 Tax=Psychroflexus tropicus TaxID=197345 RepID=UPI00037460B6|nr:hypothetical protein [Psychroflexus tropicus]
MRQIIIVFFFMNYLLIHSQPNEFEIGIYNVSLGGIGSGIGAVINKKPNEKFLKVFTNGFLKGSVGGALIFGSKKMVSQIYIEEKLEYNWPAKVLNSLGTSIIENASSNRGFLEQIHINIGFNRIEFYPNEDFRVKYKLMPAAFVTTFVSAIDSKPEWNLMLRSGEVIFSTNESNLNNLNAQALLTSFKVRESEIKNYSVLAHEIIHLYQYNDYNFVNPYFNNYTDKLSMANNFIKSYIYWDFNSIVIGGLYQLENINRSNYYDNFYEYEAAFFSDTLYQID